MKILVHTVLIGRVAWRLLLLAPIVPMIMMQKHVLGIIQVVLSKSGVNGGRLRVGGDSRYLPFTFVSVSVPESD